MGRAKEIAREIAEERRRLTDLRSEIARREERVEALQRELAESGEHVGGRVSEGNASSSAYDRKEKVKLFRSLFRGREDVFPRLWENSKTGKSGYSPACMREWDPELCAKKRGRNPRKRLTCGECPNQAFLPVTDGEIVRHLTGKQVMGVYPLLPDETCRFLAMDFDGKGWQEDVEALLEACRAHNLNPAVERSRSGDGAHAWFFFKEVLSAHMARKMGCFLITEAMARRDQIPMKSYDRLFPNQDTMPQGGFGNLIALPLQRKARERGNSVFLDGRFEPFADPWAYLAKAQRLDPETVSGIAEEASRRGKVIGIRMGESSEDAEPWNRLPSGEASVPAYSEPVPEKVRVVLSQRLFIERAGLPSPILNQLKRTAAFQNPEFYKKQGMRLSTALTPRVISCSEDLPDHVVLPRGCLEEVRRLLTDYGIDLQLEDKREEGSPLDYRFLGKLTPIQEEAVREFVAHNAGVLVAPPGSGKTVMGTYLVAERGRNALILVHRKQILEQWVAHLSQFLGIGPGEIGRIGAGANAPNGKLDVAMFQSLVRRGKVDDRVAGYGHVIVDEAHHVPSVSFERVMAEAKARYVLGLTATPVRRDGHQPILHMQLGPVRFKLKLKGPEGKSPFVRRLIVRETKFTLPVNSEPSGIQDLYGLLAQDAARNDLIFDDVVAAVDEGRSPILLTERRDHLEHFAEQCRGFVRNLVVLHGGMGAKARREALARLAEIPADEERLLLATGRYIGEGFDDARLDTLFLALPVSWRGTLVQYAGRLDRSNPGKEEIRVYDYVDGSVPMLRKMFERRLKGYQSLGYKR